jgi:para-nitrobenzyl esterase
MGKKASISQWIGCGALICAVVATIGSNAGAQSKTPIPGDPIAIDTGKVAGTVLESGVHAYLGVPFAAPPVGDLRWHEPVPPKPWTGVYDASSFKPACAQRGAGAGPGTNAQYSEDCLYLNVWAPANAKAGAKLPVIVFIYGGGFSGGTASSPGYSGEQLAERGVIRVNLAYRVGVFGYFAHPELTKEAGHGTGDWGSLDQVAGLKWIQRNIAAFGGDPANVTLMGQSAGSESVFQLQLSPLARGLFAKISAWSGADLAPGGQVPHSLAEGEAVGLKVQSMLNAKGIAEMRAMGWEQILDTLSQQQGGAAGPGGGIQTRPIVDGYFLPDVPSKIFEAGKQMDVPLYTCSTQEDLGSGQQFYNDVHTVADLQKVGKDAFGDSADEFFKLFPASTDEEARKVALIVSGDTGFGVSNRDWARADASTGKQPVYLAQWAHVPPPNKPGIPARNMFGNGATHGSDIAYWLGTYVANTSKEWADWDKQLSSAMQDSLIAFAKTSNPNTSAVKVPRYDLKNEQRVIFGDSIYVEKMNTDQVEFLRSHPLKRVTQGGAQGAAPVGR